jgi:hypothetical protein
MPHDQQAIQQTKRNRWNDEQIHRRDAAALGRNIMSCRNQARKNRQAFPAAAHQAKDHIGEVQGC